MADTYDRVFRERAVTAYENSEHRHRRVRRRYTPTLQQQALEYWRQRRRHEGVRAIAAGLGVSVSTLQRRTRQLATRSRFRRVEVRHPMPSTVGLVPVVITMTGDGPRVEGLQRAVDHRPPADR